MGRSALTTSSTGMSAGQITRLLDAARGGCDQAANQLLDACRGYLQVVARQHLDQELRAKVGISDLVQETLLQAHGHLAEFRGSSERELLGWLRAVMKHAALAARRHYRTAQRDVGREVPLEQINGQGEAWLPALDDTPRRRVSKREEQLRIRQAIARLPEHYAEVIDLRNHQLLDFGEIGKRLSLSADGARKRWYRALRRLQSELESSG